MAIPKKLKEVSYAKGMEMIRNLKFENEAHWDGWAYESDLVYIDRGKTKMIRPVYRCGELAGFEHGLVVG